MAMPQRDNAIEEIKRLDAPARSAQGEAWLGRSGAHAVEAGQGTPYGGTLQRHSIRRQGADTAPHTQHPHENG